MSLLTLAAGDPAVKFFEDSNPEIPRYGTNESESDNPAEWIVNLTTKVHLISVNSIQVKTTARIWNDLRNLMPEQQ